MRPSSIAILTHHRRRHSQQQQQQQQQQRWEELVAGVSHSATGWHSDASKLGRRLVARVAVTSARRQARSASTRRPRYKCARQISPNFIRSLQFIIYRTYKRGRAMDGTSSLPLQQQQHSQHHQQQAQQQHQQQQIQHAKRLHLHQHLTSPSSSTDSATVTSGKSCNKSNQSSNFRSYVHWQGLGGRRTVATATAAPRSPAPWRTQYSIISNFISSVVGAGWPVDVWFVQLGLARPRSGT